jgi:protein ImuA
MNINASRRLETLKPPKSTVRETSTVSLGEADLDAALPEGGLELGVIHEIVPAGAGDVAAALGFSLGLLARIAGNRQGPVLWATTQDPARHGTAYPVGLMAAGLDPGRLIQVSTRTARDMFWTLEESLTTSAFAVAFGFLARDGRHYDFTASRRLSLRAAESGGTVILLRIAEDTSGSTAAATRWSVSARPSLPIHFPGHAMPGLGPPRWQVDLMRCKRGRPRGWLVEWDHETLRFHLAAPLADRASVPRPAVIAGRSGTDRSQAA